MTVEDVPTNRTARHLTRLVWAAMLAVVALTPVVADFAGRDVFRLPKRLFFQSAMLVIGAAMAAGALLWDEVARTLIRNRRAVVFASAGLLWTGIVTMTAVVPAVSREAVLYFFCHALLFVIAVAMARSGRPVAVLTALLLPAVVNAVLVLLQGFNLWQPFVISNTAEMRMGNIGLIGNPNMAGTYLLLPAVAAFAAAVTLRRARLLLGAVTLLLLAAIFQAQTITVLIGVAAALIAFVLTASWKTRVTAVAIAALGITALFLYGPTKERLRSLNELLQQRDWVTLTSLRLPATGVALDMARERPLTGFGPGGFAARYMPYRNAIEERHPDWIKVTRESFGEAHNDHAQLLAETGIPGYALFVIFLIVIARMTFRRRPAGPEDERARFARTFAFPAAAGFAAVALGQFPLELTAVSATATFAAAVCFAWSEHAGS